MLLHLLNSEFKLLRCRYNLLFMTFLGNSPNTNNDPSHFLSFLLICQEVEFISLRALLFSLRRYCITRIDLQYYQLCAKSLCFFEGSLAQLRSSEHTVALLHKVDDTISVISS